MRWGLGLLTGALLMGSGVPAVAQQQGPAAPASPAPNAAPNPNPKELEALLRELDQQAAEAQRLTSTPTAAPEPVRQVDSRPFWSDMVVPVLALRVRPQVLLGHPAAERLPRIQGDFRGWVGAQVHPAAGLEARVVLSAHPSVPLNAGLGSDALLDAWIQWAYDALGGQLRLRAGRQEMGLSELVLADNTWLQRPPRLDGVRAHVAWNHVFVTALAGLEVPGSFLTAAAEVPDVTGLAVVQGGLEDGPARQLELHALVLQRSAPLTGDAGAARAQLPLLDVGGNAAWDAYGVYGRAAVDLQQRHFETPSVLAPAWAAHLSAGYAPGFAVAVGAYAEGGLRGAGGQPMTWLPGALGGWSGWKDVRSQEFDPAYGTRHGAMGQMDLLRLQNGYAGFARVGLRRDHLKDFSFTLWRLALFNSHADWFGALGNPMLRAGEALADPRIGWEADLSAVAELTRHISLSGAVGLLYAEPEARRAGFGGFAQTAWLALDFNL